MIGFYNYTVILTYVGLMSSIFGIYMTFKGSFLTAVFCLIVSGVCDMFDGMVARSCKNRSELAKNFGIQIDSLCDLICFGVFPGFFNITLTQRYCEKFSIVSLLISALFILCAVIRLGYFNVMEMERQKETSEVRKFYQGLPVTTIAGFLPLLFTFRNVIGFDYFYIVLNILILALAVLFVLNFKIPKPHKRGVMVMSLLALIMIIVLSLQGLNIINF